MISCLILTLNEECNIAECIGSIPWRSDIRVLDSNSTDATREIAARMGGKVVTRDFTNFADQRNFGLSLSFDHDWILMIDADERLTPELAAEIEKVITDGNDFAMMLARRKDIFLGRWLRRSSGYPTWFPRVLRKGAARVCREINEEYLTSGRKHLLNEHLLHYPFNKGVDWWFKRHNDYSTMESIKLLEERRARPLVMRDMFSLDPLRRRAAGKQLIYRMPLRPFLIFIYLYVLRLGFLDGAAGYLYAQMRMSYEVMIDAKSEEIRMGQNSGT